jgi:hypothetical protein
MRISGIKFHFRKKTGWQGVDEKGPEQLLPRPVKTPKTLLTNLMKTHV